MNDEVPDREKSMLDAFSAHFDSFGSPLEAMKQTPRSGVLFDITSRFRELIQTGGDKRKEAEFRDRFQQFKQETESLVEKTAQALAKKYPSLSQDQLKQFIQKNITCICRVDLENMNGIKVLPLFTDLAKSHLEKAHPALMNFIEATGLYVNGVTMRRYLLEEQTQSVDVEFSKRTDKPEQMLARYFPTQNSLVQTNIFKMLSKKFASDEWKEKPHIAILGKSTLQLLKGLMGEISEQKWEELNKDPATCQVLQNALSKIAKYLAEANLHINEYDKFAQNIELIHYEMATILELGSVPKRFG